MVVLVPAAPVAAQTAPAAAQSAQPAESDPLPALAFLEGAWDAKATGKDGIAKTGTYVFRTERDK